MENNRVKKQTPKKNLWKPEEDLILKKYVETHGEGKWATVSKQSGQDFCHQLLCLLVSYFQYFMSVKTKETDISLFIFNRFEERWKKLQIKMEKLS